MNEKKTTLRQEGECLIAMRKKGSLVKLPVSESWSSIERRRDVGEKLSGHEHGILTAIRDGRNGVVDRKSGRRGI